VALYITLASGSTGNGLNVQRPILGVFGILRSPSGTSLPCSSQLQLSLKPETFGRRNAIWGWIQVVSVGKQTHAFIFWAIEL